MIYQQAMEGAGPGSSDSDEEEGEGAKRGRRGREEGDASGAPKAYDEEQRQLKKAFLQVRGLLCLGCALDVSWC